MSTSSVISDYVASESSKELKNPRDKMKMSSFSGNSNAKAPSTASLRKSSAVSLLCRNEWRVLFLLCVSKIHNS